MLCAIAQLNSIGYIDTPGLFFLLGRLLSALIDCFAFTAISDAARGSRRRACCALEAVFRKSLHIVSAFIGETVRELKIARTELVL